MAGIPIVAHIGMMPQSVKLEGGYKIKGRTAEQALSELERCASTQFDGQLVAAFVRAMRQLPNPIIEVTSLISRNI